MVLNKEEFLATLKNKVGEDTSDDAIKFLEDMSDTYDDLVKRTGDSDEWKKKFEENDKSWRDKYTKRFFEKTDPANTPKPDTLEDGDGDNAIKIEDLFKDKEEK